MTARHHERDQFVAAAPEEVFVFVDDHARFSSHMSEASWMMGGGRMSVELDEAQGQAEGSHIRLSGRVFGVRLFGGFYAKWCVDQMLVGVARAFPRRRAAAA